MCLAVPGKILSIVDHDGIMRTGMLFGDARTVVSSLSNEVKAL